MADSRKAPKARKRAPTKEGGSEKSRAGGTAEGGPSGSAAVARSVEFAMRGMAPRLPWAGACVHETEPVAAAEKPPGPAPRLRDWTHAPIDRSDPTEVFFFDVTVRNPETQQVVLILRRPYGFPAGSLPADPSSFAALHGATSPCRVLSPVAAVRCGAWGRYA